MLALRSLAAGAIVATAIGCEKEATFVEPLPSYAAIHWVNAVPDTMQQDFRVVDMVSNAGLFDANFRASNMFYQPIEAGTRTVRVFLSSTDPAIAKTILREDNIALTAGSSYTYLHLGFARTGLTPARNGVLIPDASPTPAAGQVAVRVINAAANVAGNAVNVFFTRRTLNATPADTLPDTPTFANVAFGAASAYASIGTDTLAADSMRVVVTAVGSKVPLAGFGLAGIKAPVGVAGTPAADPIAGSRVHGSVLSAVIIGPSLAGSTAPQGGAFVNPTAIFLVDRRPPKTAP